MRRLLHTLVAAMLVAACSSTGEPTPPPPPPPLTGYLLESVSYEDVYPGYFTRRLVSYNGRAAMVFGDSGQGFLEAPSSVIGQLKIVYADSTQETRTIEVLPVGEFDFTFALIDSIVMFTSGPDLWPIASGAKLTDSTYTYDNKSCFNADCTDYIWLAFVWRKD